MLACPCPSRERWAKLISLALVVVAQQAGAANEYPSHNDNLEALERPRRLEVTPEEVAACESALQATDNENCTRYHQDGPSIEDDPLGFLSPDAVCDAPLLAKESHDVG